MPECVGKMSASLAVLLFAVIAVIAHHCQHARHFCFCAAVTNIESMLGICELTIIVFFVKQLFGPYVLLPQTQQRLASSLVYYIEQMTPAFCGALANACHASRLPGEEVAALLRVATLRLNVNAAASETSGEALTAETVAGIASLLLSAAVGYSRPSLDQLAAASTEMTVDSSSEASSLALHAMAPPHMLVVSPGGTAVLKKVEAPVVGDNGDSGQFWTKRATVWSAVSQCVERTAVRPQLLSMIWAAGASSGHY